MAVPSRELAIGCLCLLLAACAPHPVKRPRSSPPPRSAPAPTPAPAPAGAPVTAPGPLNPAIALDASVYKLANGDVVHVEVLGEQELSVTAPVDAIGNISYPFLGQVPAAGLTLRQLEQKIVVGLRSGYLKNPDVRASIASYRPIYVSGQVRQTGAYPYTTGLTVEKAITLAGGTTQFASSSRIYVQRAGAAQEKREKVELDTPVFPGDTVVVEERLF